MGPAPLYKEHSGGLPNLGGTVAELRIEREVAAPAADVWAVMTDLERSPEIISGIDAIERLDGGGDFRVGTSWRETRTLMGRQVTEEMQVTAVDPGRAYTVEADSRGAHYRSVLGVEPMGSGRCRVFMTFDGQPGSTLGKVMAATVGRLFEGATRKALEKDLADIAAAAERRA